MIELVPLCTAVLDIALPLYFGVGAAGERSIGDIRGATIEGARIKARLVGQNSADWMIRSAGTGVIDVRMALRTDDDALIYMRYGGRLVVTPDGEQVSYVAPVFETGDPRYAWLNPIQAIGRGRVSALGDAYRVDYEFYEPR